MSWLWSFVEYFHGLFASIDDFLSYALDIDSLASILPELEVVVGLVEQVDDLLVVYFEERAPNDKIDSILSLPINTFK